MSYAHVYYGACYGHGESDEAAPETKSCCKRRRAQGSERLTRARRPSGGAQLLCNA